MGRRPALRSPQPAVRVRAAGPLWRNLPGRYYWQWSWLIAPRAGNLTSSEAGRSVTEEIYLDRARGVAHYYIHPNGTYLHYDDGTSLWSSRVGGALVRRAKSAGTPAQILAQANDWISAGPVREAAADQVIDGVACRAYTITKLPPAVQSTVWVDEQNLIRRLRLEVRSEGSVKSVAEGNTIYNQPIDPAKFPPPPPPEAIVEGEDWLARQFPVAAAESSQRLGQYTFAVHSLEAGPDGLLYLVCSLRTAEGRAAAQGNSPWLANFGVSDSPVNWAEQIASISEGGCWLKHVIVGPTSAQAPIPGRCTVVVVIPGNDAGMPGPRDRYTVTLEARRADNAMTAVRIADRAFAAAQRFDGVLRVRFWDQEPPEFSREQYLKRVQEQIERRWDAGGR